MKNTWQQLKPHYQLKIRKAAHRFNTAKRLKYTLMASDGWYDLQLNTIRDILMLLTSTAMMLMVQILCMETNF